MLAAALVAEYWIDPSSVSTGLPLGADLPVILLTSDGLGQLEVKGPSLECMTREAGP